MHLRKSFHLIILSLIFSLLNNCIATYLDKKEEHGKDLENLLGILASSGQEVGSGYASPERETILRSNDGLFEVHIPTGAMREEQQFTITRYDASNRTYPGGYYPTSPVYDIQPSYVFDKPVTVAIIMNSETVTAHGAERTRSVAFKSSTSSTIDWGHIPGWQSQKSGVSDFQVRFTTNSFSTFGAGTPPAGNLAPVISGAFYYFKPSCSYLPYRVRTSVSDPDGDSFLVYLVIGPEGGITNSIPMVAEGGGWFHGDIPYEAMIDSGIQMQVLAVDQYGNSTTVPTNGVFHYPTDSGNPTFISNYSTDKDGDGLLDAWEVDNGYNPNDPNDPTGILDTDGDGIPDSGDNTPNGEPNPTIDSLTIVPSEVYMDVGELVTFSVNASYGGSPRFVDPSLVTTGNALSGNSVGTLNGPVFTANEPGLAGITATVGNRNAVATVRVSDTIGPNNITDLTAIPISNSKIRLQWTAPGNDGPNGKASSYEVRRSNSAITNDASCTAAAPMNQNLVPKNSGLTEILEINGLSPNTTYYFCVRAFDSEGNRNSWTGNVQTTTASVADITPPANISSATASTLSASQIQLSWNAVGDDGNTGSAMSYEIRRSTMPITSDAQCDAAIQMNNSLVSSPAGTPLNFIAQNLSDNTIYYFCIRAFDDSNNRSSWTATLVATTLNANDPPLSIPAPSHSVNVGAGASVDLDGSSSFDPDGTYCGANTSNYIYSWTILNKPPSSAVNNASIVNSNSTNASFVPDVTGVYTFQLSFTDDPGACGGGARTSVGTIQIYATIDSLGPTINSYNFRNNSTIESGFLNFDVSDPSQIAKTEISLDGNSYQILTPETASLSYYRYKLPTGAASWRKDSWHTITLRATDNTGNVTTKGPVSVRMGDNRDINGDGFPDLVISATHSGGTIGQVYLYYSTPLSYGQANAILTGGAGGNFFGTSTALGDVNGDGFADVIVGGYYGESGFVYIFYSNGKTGLPSANAADAGTRLIGVAEGDHFGQAVAVGDSNCDGYADILVGAMEAGSNHHGAAYLFQSTGNGGIISQSGSTANAIFNAATESPRFGASKVDFGFPVALSDLNGDGCSEAVIASRGAEKVYIFNSLGSVGISSDSVLNANSIVSSLTGIDFGRVFAIGDANGDGYMDLVVAAPGAGVYAFHSQGPGGIPAQSVATANSVLVRPYWGTANFASTLAMGDLTGDGTDDLAIGDSNYPTPWGMLAIVHSVAGIGLPNTNASNLPGIIITGDNTFQHLAQTTLQITDVSGDGRKDILSDLVNDRAVIIWNSGAGIQSYPVVDIARIISGAPGSRYGASN